MLPITIMWSKRGLKMSLNLYGNIGTTYTGIVTGAELERVSKEIFGGAQVKANEGVKQTSTQQTVQHTPAQETSQINLYNRNTDINLTQQVAQAKVDFNVQLSPQALQNIEALNTPPLEFGLLLISDVQKSLISFVMLSVKGSLLPYFSFKERAFKRKSSWPFQLFLRISQSLSKVTTSSSNTSFFTAAIESIRDAIQYI